MTYKNINDNIITVREHEQKKGGSYVENVILNHDKLKGRIKEVLGTQSRLAEELDLDETTISNKINSNTYFTQKEILKTCLVLKIPKDEIPEYFFKEKVREHEQK